MALTLWQDVERGLTNSEMDANFSELAGGTLAQSVSDNRPLIKPSLNLDFTKGSLDPRITFTRSSAATYIGSNGLLKTAGINEPRFDYDPITRECKGLLIEEQRTNLLTYSEQFDNAAWTKTGMVVITNTATAPDGTLSADKLANDTTAGTHRLQQIKTVTNATYTYSIYAKAAEVSSIALVLYDGAAGTTVANVRFDLSNGTISTATLGLGTIQSIGNGWYRCSVTTVSALQAGTTSSWVYSGVNPNDGYSGIYIWGAQLEAGAFPTSYIKTEASQVTRAADAAYLSTANWIRFDEGTLLFDFVQNLPYSAIDATCLYFGAFPTASLANGQDSGYALYSNHTFLTRNPTNTSPSMGYVAGKSNIALAIDFAGKYGCQNGGEVKTNATPGTNRSGEPGFFSLSGSASSIKHQTVRRVSFYPQRLTNTQLQELTK